MANLDEKARAILDSLAGSGEDVAANLAIAAMMSTTACTIRYALEGGRDGFRAWMKEVYGAELEAATSDDMLRLAMSTNLAVSMEILQAYQEYL